MVLFLAIVWAAVLAYMFWPRAAARPSDSIVSFRRQLGVIQRTRPGVPPGPATFGAGAQVVPINGHSGRLITPGSLPGPDFVARARRARTLKRRRDVLASLLVCMGATLLLGLIGLRPVWILHLVFDALFVAYVALLIRMRNIAAEKELKLRLLPTPPPAAAPAPARTEPVLLLRRSAN